MTYLEEKLKNILDEELKLTAKETEIILKKITTVFYWQLKVERMARNWLKSYQERNK